MHKSDAGLGHGTSGSPQGALEELEYEAKTKQIEEELRKEFPQQESKEAALANLQRTERFADGAVKHIFNGEINPKGKAVGYHYEGLAGTDGRVIPGTKSAEDSSGVYRAEVEVNGVRKREGSTFFPKSWTPQQVVNAINKAYDGREHLQENLYTGTVNGVRIMMRLDKNGKISTAYPQGAMHGLRR